MALLSNELTNADTAQVNMEEVHNRETQLLVHRDDFSKENDGDVTSDIKEQCKNHEINLNIHEGT